MISEKNTTLLELTPSVKYNVSVISVTKFDSSPPLERDFKTRKRDYSLQCFHIYGKIHYCACENCDGCKLTL